MDGPLEELNKIAPCPLGCPEEEPCLDSCPNRAKKVTFIFLPEENNESVTLMHHHCEVIWPAISDFNLTEGAEHIVKMDYDLVPISYSIFVMYIHITFLNFNRKFPQAHYGLHDSDELTPNVLDIFNMSESTFERPLFFMMFWSTSSCTCKIHMKVDIGKGHVQKPMVF